MLRYTTDRARPDLVAFYDIRPGNGSGLFLQPRNPHGEVWGRTDATISKIWSLENNEVGKQSAKVMTEWHYWNYIIVSISSSSSIVYHLEKWR